uniref:Uncharacterized protein n=1 Tax=Compsopogon caeruleus TaxID=31354 RepID=A0A7S1TH11_9RHOD
MVSAVGEVVFGLFGVLVAFYFLAFRKFNAMVTKIFISVQFLLGWFVFLTFVVADPINVAVHATEGQDTLSLSQRRFALIVGQLFGSVAFCYALQGGQFIHGIRFLNLNEEGSIPVKKDRIRSYIWNGNLILAGFSTICIGALLHANPIEELFIPFPPHLVWYPTMSLVTGIVMSCYGILGLLATSSESLASWMVNSFPVVLLLMLGNFSFTQGKLLGVDVPLLGAAQLVGLVFCVTILPVYFTYKVHHPDE